MRESLSFEERLDELKQKYEPSNDFNLIQVLELEDEYELVTKNNPEHTKRRREILDMRDMLLSRTRVKSKEEAHIIPLIEFDSVFKNEWIVFDNDNILLNMTNILIDKLEQGRRQNKLIDTTGFRCIGKTQQLIKFAKKNNYIAIIRNNIDYFRYMCEYNEVYGQYSKQIRGAKSINCVIDEGVDINIVKKELRLNIVTGYMNKNIN